MTLLEPHLSAISSDYDKLVTEGYCFDKGKVTTVSPYHAWLIYSRLMPDFTYADPCPENIDTDLAALADGSEWKVIPAEFQRRFDVLPEYVARRKLAVGCVGRNK